MSFGFSISDFIELSQLVNDLTRRVRTAGAEFREFAGDLEVARILFTSIQEQGSTPSGRATTTWLQQNHSTTIQTIIAGIQHGLDELRSELDTRSQTPLARFRSFNRLDSLRRRLDFHMGSLQLLMQNLSLMQGRRIEEAMRLINEGQEEQRREEERGEGSSAQGLVDSEWNENLVSFERLYVQRNAGRARPDEASNSSSSRDYVIERWRTEVAAALSARSSASDSPSERTSSSHLPQNPFDRPQTIAYPDPSVGRSPSFRPPEFGIHSDTASSEDITAVESQAAHGGETTPHQQAPHPTVHVDIHVSQTTSAENCERLFLRYFNYTCWALWFIAIALAVADVTFGLKSGPSDPA